MSASKTVKAWGYLCRDSEGKYSTLAIYANSRKPYCANPAVRVRIIKETEWKKIKANERHAKFLRWCRKHPTNAGGEPREASARTLGSDVPYICAFVWLAPYLESDGKHSFRRQKCILPYGHVGDHISNIKCIHPNAGAQVSSEAR